MGAMMCLLAREEMKVSSAKAVRVVDAYIGPFFLATFLALHILSIMQTALCACGCTPLRHSFESTPMWKLCRRRPSYVNTARICYPDRHLHKGTVRSLKVETVIYSSCAGCGKPIARPAAQPLSASRPFRGAFAYCLACKKPTVHCSIWFAHLFSSRQWQTHFPFSHLPVRSLLFQCSVCQHGGHQSCYRKYYMEHPMVELPTSLLPSEDRGRSLMRIVQEGRSSKEDNSDSNSIMSTRSESSVLGTSAPSPTRTESSGVTTRLMGHACVSGCGHICWAANMLLDGKDSAAAQPPLDP